MMMFNIDVPEDVICVHGSCFTCSSVSCYTGKLYREQGKDAALEFLKQFDEMEDVEDECDLVLSNGKIYVFIACIAVIFHIMLMVIPKSVIDLIFIIRKHRKLAVPDFSNEETYKGNS